nr:MAG TPA: hypothetical protein [Caudoviricetes sp.]
MFIIRTGLFISLPRFTGISIFPPPLPSVLR